jgi:YHS domain-containing protein
MGQSATSNQIFIDPVCLMKMAPGKKKLVFNHQMRTFFFCAESCRKAFEANPDKYLASRSPKRKGWWGRYLERLNKATGGKPPRCCP